MVCGVVTRESAEGSPLGSVEDATTLSGDGLAAAMQSVQQHVWQAKGVLYETVNSHYKVYMDTRRYRAYPRHLSTVLHGQ